MFAREKALNNWKNLVDAVYFPQDPSITTDLDIVPASLHEADKSIYDILRVANEIEKQNIEASLALYEHALSLSHDMDPRSEGRGVLQFKTGLISHIKKNSAAKDGRTLVTMKPERRSKVLKNFYDECRRVHATDRQPPPPKDVHFYADSAEEVNLNKWTLRVLQNVLLSSYSRFLTQEFKEQLESDAKLLEQSAPFNILPLADEFRHLVIMKFPEVIAARNVLNVPREIKIQGLNQGEKDVFHALEVAFRFQIDNLNNQREHLILLLANTEFQWSYKNTVERGLHQGTINEVCDKTLDNYKSWCSYIRTDCVYDGASDFEKLAYAALYLCIWGEAANIRFLPECICCLFHTLAQQLKSMLRGHLITCSKCFCKDKTTQLFLEVFIAPIYEDLKKEAEKGKRGEAHSKWRNYDDFNELYWSRSCLTQAQGSNANVRSPSVGSRTKKVSFVEHRTFWHLYHSFVRVWILLFLMLQGLAVLAFTEERNVNTLKILLSLGPTYFAMKLIESILDIVMMMGLHVSSRGDAMSRIITHFLFYGGCSCGIGYLYWKVWLEKPPSYFYLKLMLLILGSYATLKLILSLFQHMPLVRKQVEKLDKYPVIACLKWLFKERFYVGRGLYEDLRDFTRYAGFWIIVLACKFSFSYFFQILPLAKASITIFSNEVEVNYVWHDFVSERNHNALALFFLWAPIVMIYLLDIQIWYTIFSAIIGGIIGAKDRLGEIRSLDMLRNRFDSFSKAYVKKMQHPRLPSSTSKSGMEPTDEDFAPFWNNIINWMREEDYITNEEKDLLLMPPKGSEIQFAKWPVFLLASKVSLAMKVVKGNPDAISIIRGDKYMAAAVKEAYESVNTLLKEMVLDGRGIDFFTDICTTVNKAINENEFSKMFQTSNIEAVHSRISDLLKLLDKKTPIESSPNNQELEREAGKALRNIYDAVLQCLQPDKRKSVEQENSVSIFRNAKLPNPDKKLMIRRLHLLLTTTELGSCVPKNIEAQRRLEFFANSLFMKMPLAPSIKAMKSFSVLTPYFKETVLFSLDDLHKENEDGITVLFYLQRIFPDEWKNFLERLNINEDALTDILQKNHNKPYSQEVLETRLWASYRGQTLARTVRGMMYYRRALELQAYTEEASDPDDGKRVERAEALADLKFTYVVSCQIYREQKLSPIKEEQAKAEDILYLMKVYKALRIAFIHSEVAGKENHYYSKLVKIGEDGKDQEIYSIKLPGNPILGEGKPENQNHAIIFTRGAALQTIDMNQDNSFEESLKIRNLLEEFNADYGLRKPTILGVREHIFTGSVSSLAWFMSNQETSFVTIGQRVLARPLKVRMHYGHPDVFDRLFHITRGGISKASKTINVSEDIFAGFNSTLRQGNITHHEYIQIGKGRDVGLNQIAMFEAKVSSGNGEQLLSRDVYRLGQLFDFFRMLSFYVTSVGYYACTMMTALVVYIFLYGKAYLALSGVGRALATLALEDKALQTALDTQFLFQIGFFTTIPMLVVFMLEQGFFKAIYYFIVMQLQLSSVFFTFSLGTRSHYFGETVLHGGAKYRETGRGFVVQHIKFAQNYRLYSRSHFVKALEIVMLLSVILVYGSYESTRSYILLSLFSWFLAISWLFAPFIFNPSGFEWQKTVEDFDNWTNWLFNRGGVGVDSNDSWETWWNESQKDKQSLYSALLKSLLSLRFLLFQFGVVYQLRITNANVRLSVYGYSWLVFLSLIIIFLVFSISKANYQMELRLCQGVFFVMLGMVVVVALAMKEIYLGDVFASLLAFVPTGWGLLLIAIAWHSVLKRLHLWRVVKSIAWYYDAGMGMLIFSPIAILSWFPFVSTFQTRLLFNQAFSRGLEISIILAGRKT